LGLKPHANPERLLPIRKEQRAESQKLKGQELRAKSLELRAKKLRAKSQVKSVER
jgi:hypothetical protein